MIAKLLGHTQIQTTARYAHLARNSVEVAAVRIAESFEADMDTPPDVSAARFGSPALEPGDTVPINGVAEAGRRQLAVNCPRVAGGSEAPASSERR